MTTPLWCLGIVVLLPYLIAPITGYFKARQLGTYDNASPRAQAAELGGPGARSVWAQANAWEAVALFTVVVLVNQLKGDADPARSALWAQLFVVCRVLHAGLYIANLDTLRSLVFLVSAVAAGGLFLA
jgi:uncharacterized MAPEG superfamily protein